MSETVPMFPLNTVLFPGLSVPLVVFEDRYRALIHQLLRIEDPADRVFGSVAIREGYEVGDHGVQSVHRIGCLLQLTEVDPRPDGSFDIVAVCRRRLRLDAMDASGPFLRGEVELLDEDDEASSDVAATGSDAAQAARTLAVFERYRSLMSEIRGERVLAGTMPTDPAFLSWTLAATCLLSMPDRQWLLEATSASERLAHLEELMRGEVEVMSTIPSLPATEVARTRWSPN